MMRTDRMKRILKAGRPEPTPMFSNAVSRTLDKLPKKQKHFTLPRFAPISAIAVAAFAVFCFYLMNNAAQPAQPQKSFVAAAGTETTQPVTESPQPQQTAGSNPEATPINTAFMQPVNQSSTDNGITETVLEAGTDGMFLQMKVKAGPFKEYTAPAGKTRVNIGGTVMDVECSRPFGGDKTWDGDSSAAYCTYMVATPLPQEVSGDMVEIELSDEFKLPSQIYIENAEDEKNLTFTNVSLKIAFSLPVSKREKLNATGEGLIAFGNEASVESVSKSAGFTVFTLDVKDNRNGVLGNYVEQTAKAKKVSTETPVAFGQGNIGYILCTRKVDVDFVKSFESFEQINLLRSSGDSRADGMVGIAKMYLQKIKGGQFRLMIIVEEDFIPTSDVTIITKNCASRAGRGDANYALQVHMQGVAPANAAPEPKATPDAAR